MSTEIWMLEQQRTALLDEIMDRYPKCDCCGCPITTYNYLMVFDKNVCNDCVNVNMQTNMEAISFD